MTRITRKFLSNTRAVVYFLPQLSSVRAAQPRSSGFSHQKEVIRDMRRQNASLLAIRRNGSLVTIVCYSSVAGSK